jgi:hypothetical protein
MKENAYNALAIATSIVLGLILGLLMVITISISRLFIKPKPS